MAVDFKSIDETVGTCGAHPGKHDGRGAKQEVSKCVPGAAWVLWVVGEPAGERGERLIQKIKPVGQPHAEERNAEFPRMPPLGERYIVRVLKVGFGKEERRNDIGVTKIAEAHRGNVRQAEVGRPGRGSPPGC